MAGLGTETAVAVFTGHSTHRHAVPTVGRLHCLRWAARHYLCSWGILEGGGRFWHRYRGKSRCKNHQLGKQEY